MTDQIPSIEKLLRDVKKAGFRVNNMFHRMDGQWQVNLRSAMLPSTFFDWAYGVDPADAIERALTKAKGGRTVYKAMFRNSDDDLDPRITGHTKDPTNPIPPDASDDEDLLGAATAAVTAITNDIDDLLG